MTAAYPEFFAWRASLRADHLGVSTEHKCVTGQTTVRTGLTNNTAVRVSNSAKP